MERGNPIRHRLCVWEKGISAIIDDGLFIYNDSVVCGVSAKRQSTRLVLLRLLFFKNDEIAEETKKKIRKISPKNILILGTSDNMVDKIAARLELQKSAREYI